MTTKSGIRQLNPGIWLETRAEQAIRDSLENGMTLTLADVADLWKAMIAYKIMRTERRLYSTAFTFWALRWLAAE